MRALWSDKQGCSHNVSHEATRIRPFSRQFRGLVNRGVSNGGVSDLDLSFLSRSASGGCIQGVQVLREKRLISLHGKRVGRAVKMKLRPPLCRPLKHSMILFKILFGTFPIFLGFSRDCPGIFPICPFPLSRPINSTYEEQSRKGPRHYPDLSRKSRKPLGLETPGLPSLKDLIATHFQEKSPHTPHKC